MLEPNPAPQAARRERQPGNGLDRLEIRPAQAADVADDDYPLVRLLWRLRGSDQPGTSCH
jgi:hypothetical protein